MIRACLALTTTTAMVSLALAQSASANAPHASSAGSPLSAGHTLTLITGDQVTVDAKGELIGVRRAAGRENVPFQTRTVGGHTLVVPADAAAMIAAGKLDRRLFDVTELNKERTDQRNGLKVIVGFKGTAAAARADVRDAATVRRTLPSLDAAAVRAPKQHTGRLWDAVMDGGRTAPGVAHVWLDGVRRASLDKSVPQIGAPTAWQAGYTGKGVKIAVLDTGVDADHPDLKGQVAESRNFSTSADTDDHYGHGTHVASIAAGTGAGSHGTYKGVAPDAKILNGKVLGDDGSGDDSAILAGMEWAADQGADIINLSLGGTDSPEVDPLEAEVNRLSEEKGVLFTIAAGNEGEYGDGTVDSPGSAADALTVGAVDGKDRLADFSSRGPAADGSVKPDVTAPGVDITAAAAPGSVIDKEEGENPPGYLTISGTSMATPHVAGAAALLKQEHPDWGYARLKSALTASAKAGDYTPFEQGSGRIAVDRAVRQTVLAEQPSLSFGIQRWPHTDDTPVTKRLTYRNLGTKDVTLALAASVHAPDGGTAPAGFLKLSATSVTVPAGGTAFVEVRVDTRPGGSADGAYSGYVTASGGGQSVRTAMGVQREVQSYDLTLKYLDRAGESPVHLTTLYGYSGLAGGRTFDSESAENTVTLRVPKGKYLLDSLSVKSLTADGGPVDWLTQPVLNVDRNTTVTIDLTRTRASDITVPDPAAKPLDAFVAYTFDDASARMGVDVTSFADLRTAHLGPAVSSGLSESWLGQWKRSASSEYDVFTGADVTRFEALTRHYRATDLATVRAGLSSSVPGRTGAVTLYGELPIAHGDQRNRPLTQRLPGTRTLHISTGDGVYWALGFDQYAPEPDADGNPVSQAQYADDDARTYQGGRTYRTTFGGSVIAPRVSADYGLYRYGNEIAGQLPLFADAAGHGGSSDFTSVRTTLFRNGTEVGSNTDPLFGQESFKVPSGKARYRLSTSVKRSAGVARDSSRIDATWTFTSQKASDTVPLPASTLRIAAQTDLTGRASARRKVTVPVTVQGSAAGRNLGSLAVWASYDGGRHWTKLAVDHGHVTYRNPAKDKSVSFKYRITDKKGNASAVTVHDAYYGS
ncbi:S8 family serine peptidase [Streptomyces sp. NPDC048282]|uniref:S8 family serine peptidase n=1 Tax=Streptomyces sp. NPDC048282 TaxID=3365528 RepID=UPI00371FC55E